MENKKKQQQKISKRKEKKKRRKRMKRERKKEGRKKERGERKMQRRAEEIIDRKRRKEVLKGDQISFKLYGPVSQREVLNQTKGGDRSHRDEISLRLLGLEAV